MKGEYNISERNYTDEIKRLDGQLAMQVQTFEAAKMRDGEELQRLH